LQQIQSVADTQQEKSEPNKKLERKFLKELEKCKEVCHGKKWTDKYEFEPNDYHLGDRSDRDCNIDIQNTFWKRIGDIKSYSGKLALFKDTIEDKDILQGELKDDHLLMSLACLAQFPNRIRNLFASHTVNDHGVFGVDIAMRGGLVLVDDFFPTNARKA